MDFLGNLMVKTCNTSRGRQLEAKVEAKIASAFAYGEALLREGIDTMLAGDVDADKALLRDYIEAAVGFGKLGEATGTQPKSFIRMFGPRANPKARNLFVIIGSLHRSRPETALVPVTGTAQGIFAILAYFVMGWGPSFWYCCSRCPEPNETPARLFAQTAAFL
jgi:hypothetical protein